MYTLQSKFQTFSLDQVYKDYLGKSTSNSVGFLCGSEEVETDCLDDAHYRFDLLKENTLLI